MAFLFRGPDPGRRCQRRCLWPYRGPVRRRGHQLARAGGGGGGGGTPTPTPTPTPPNGSCAAPWNNTTAYVSGNQVSYNGSNWTANQWNDNEVPGGASGAWNSNGPC